MSLVLTEEQQMLQQAARDFLAEEAPVAAFRALRDQGNPDGFDAGLWQAMAEMGWAGILVPEAYGGLEFGHVGAGVVFEEIGRHLTVAPLLSTGVLAATALRLGGDEPLKRQLLPKLVAGELLVALALEESPRHQPEATATLAHSDGGGPLRLKGKKRWVIDGGAATRLLVSARGPDDELGIYLADPAGAGVSMESELLVDNHRVATATFDDAPVLAELAADDRGGAALITDVLDTGRACMAAELLGVAQEAFERTLEYLRTRKQFGVIIGQFQGLQHRAAHLFCELQVARSTMMKALVSLDAADPERARWVSLAKSKCARVARRATQEAIQMHGGIGMTDEFDIGFFLKRSRALELELGDAEYHADRFARALGF